MSQQDSNNNSNGGDSNNLSETSLAFIGASVTLVLAIIIIILLIISFRLCLKVVQRRYLVQAQLQSANSANSESQQNHEEDPNIPSFNWRHSLRIAGTLPPSYEEAKELPSLDDAIPLKNNDEELKIDVGNGVDSKSDKIGSDVCIDIVEDTSKTEATPATEESTATEENTAAAVTSDAVITIEPDQDLMNALNPTAS